MNNFLIRAVSIFLFLFYANHIAAHVYLDSPQGGETYTGHSIITIQWHIAIPHNQLNWDLLYSLDGGNTWEPIQWDLPVSQTTYTWVVPNIPTSMARISIIQDNTEMDYQDESDNFTILPASTAPYIDLLAQDATFICDNYLTLNINNWLESHGGATVIGECGDIEWTHDYTELSNGCSNYTGSAFVTFTATDDCGSTSTGAYLTVVDTIGPNLMRAASNHVIQCGPDNNEAINDWLVFRGGMQVFEVCSSVEWSNNYSSLSNGCGSSGSAVVTFSATDECGNITSSTATLTVEDSTGPLIIVPASEKTISCTSPNHAGQLSNWLQNRGGAAATDACGTLYWNNNYSGMSIGCGPTRVALVTFIATDNCGNSSTTAALFTIADQNAPTLITPAQNKIISCTELNPDTLLQEWLLSNGGATAADSCGNVEWSNNYTMLNVDCGITQNAMVVFTASDECGNHINTVAEFKIVDSIAPVIAIDARDTIIRCENPNASLGIRQWLSSYGGAVANDDCGQVFWTNDFPSLADTCSMTRNVLVNFVSYDECGNSDTTKATITILSTTGTNGVEENSNFKLSPNPVSDFLKFESSDVMPVHVYMFDTGGRMLHSQKDNTSVFYIPVSGYAPGVYLFRIETVQGMSIHKVLIL